MVSKGLKLNDEKSHLLCFICSKSRTEGGIPTVLRTNLGDINPSDSEKFLGGIVHKDLKWTSHILKDKDNLVSALNKRCNALKSVSRVASFKTRKTIANGLFMGKLSYLVTVWGGTSEENLRALQVAQNKAAKFVTRNWKGGTIANLRAIGWLSVRQLVFYHTAILMFKIKRGMSCTEHIAPEYLMKMFNWEYIYSTRQAERELIKPIGIPRLEVTRQGFRYRAADTFNLLPEEIRKVPSLETFKSKAKEWIKTNIRAKA